MARIRTIKPEFYSDPDLGRLSLEARYLYKSSWCFADDEGRLPADPRLLKSQTFPYDDKISVKRVSRLVEELQQAGKVIAYEVDGLHYLLFPNFVKHQVINKKQRAKYPPPPESVPDDSRSATGVGTDDSRGNRTEPKGTEHHHHQKDGDGSAKAVAFKDYLLSEGFPLTDVDIVVRRFATRIHFGEPITDPVAWAQPWLKRLAASRESEQPKVVEIEGVAHEWTTEGWKELAS